MMMINESEEFQKGIAQGIEPHSKQSINHKQTKKNGREWSNYQIKQKRETKKGTHKPRKRKRKKE